MVIDSAGLMEAEAFADTAGASGDGARQRAVGVGPSSDAAPEARGSLLAMTGLTLALTYALLVVLVPAAFVGWWESGSMVELLTGEALLRTNGLDREVFASSYWPAFAIDLAIVLWCCVRFVRRRTYPWRPLMWLCVVYAVLYAGLVIADARGDTDAPDGVTTVVLLGIAALWRYLMPIALLILVGAVVVAAFRAGRRSERRARRLSGLFVVLGLAGSYALLGRVAFHGERIAGRGDHRRRRRTPRQATSSRSDA
ncbi:MAG: hypothetical protein U1F43_32435 [Myxococcota bacterium]